MSAVLGILAPGLPHPLLTPDACEGYRRLRNGYDEAAEKLANSEAEALIIYSTMWPSVIGHQILARKRPEWVLVDELFHSLGSMPYAFDVDTELAHSIAANGKSRGLHTTTVDYHGFPIDTGTVVAASLLNPGNRLPMVAMSSNVYSDRSETVVLGKAVADAYKDKKVAVVVVGTLSNRLFTDWIAPADDRVHSLKDDEWNRKLLEFLGAGRLEDCAQLSREVHAQIRVHKVVSFKPFWFLSAAMGQHNRYDGQVHAYEGVHGTGSALVSLVPTAGGMGDKEYDEDDVEAFHGDRDVLA